jgi:hypothetical protein
VAAVGAQANFYSGVSGPASFGSGGFSFASTSSGNTFGVFANELGPDISALALSLRYQSESSLSGSSTYDNTSIHELGLTPGTYVYTWSSDSLTVNIEAVPEPATWAMMALGFAGLGFSGYRAAGRRPAVRA